MCIERVTAWAFAGRNYNNELDAVRAAIDEIGKRLIRDHASHPGQGLVANPDLPKLLLRHAELVKSEAEAPAESPEGTRPEKPEGTREHHPDCAFLADPEHGVCNCAGITGTAIDKTGAM